jgi:hypothetical protein
LDFGFDGGMFAGGVGRRCFGHLEGDKLTGTVTMGQMGEGAISEGKADGDNVSFAVVREFNGNQLRINYKGKVSGDEMKISGEVVGMDRTFEMTAKRAK